MGFRIRNCLRERELGPAAVPLVLRTDSPEKKMPDPKLKNVFEAILKYGHDEDFAPSADRDFRATQAPAGSREKLEVMAERVRAGQPLWHESDRADYSGLTGAVRPRD